MLSSAPATEYVDIYYDSKMVFQHIRKQDVEGVIQGWMAGGKARGRTYDQGKFSTQPSRFEGEVPPIAGMNRGQWEWEKEKARRDWLDLGHALRGGFYVQEAGKVRVAFGFAKVLNAHCRLHGNLQGEELLYLVMTAIREFAPDLRETDFLAVRRVVWRRVLSRLDAWKSSHPQEPKDPSESRAMRVAEARKTWIDGVKDGTKRDMLTLVFDMQLDNARKVISQGANFQPELLMWKGRELAVTFIQGPDPMTQAIAMVLQARPEGYSFAAEAWQAPKGVPFKYEKWGDIEKLEGKTEGFNQICAENNGPYLVRQFGIDRTNKVLVVQGFGGQSRMPPMWELEGAKPPDESNAGGAYA